MFLLSPTHTARISASNEHSLNSAACRRTTTSSTINFPFIKKSTGQKLLRDTERAGGIRHGADEVRPRIVRYCSVLLQLTAAVTAAGATASVSLFTVVPALVAVVQRRANEFCMLCASQVTRMNASRWDRREVGAAHSRAHERHYRTRPPQRSTITDTRPHHARDELRARSPVPVGRHYRSRSLTFNESRSHASERHFPPHRSRSPRAFRSRSPRPRSPRPRSPRRNQGREPPYWSRPGSPRRCSPRRNQSREPPYSSRSRLSRPHPNNNSNHARLPRKRSRSKSPHSRSASMSRLNMSRRDLSHSHPQEEFPRLPLSSASRPVPQQADVERARPLQQQQQQQQTLPESADVS